jgi:glycosyltransferase involved in cell wall biosynthesis
MSLRILHVLSSPHLGGAEQMCLHFAQAQSAAGHEVALHVFEPGKVTDSAQAAGITTMCSQAGRELPSHSRRERWSAYAKQLEKTIRDFRPQLLHSHVPATHLICHRVAPQSLVPWIATIHGSWKQFGYAPQTYRKPYLRPYLLLRHAAGDFVSTRSAAYLVAVSDSGERDLRLMGVSSKRIVRIHNGLPDNHAILPRENGREQLGIAPDALLIGSLGFMAPVKGYDLLIRAAKSLVAKNPRLLVVIAGGDVLGDTSVRESLRKLIERFGLQDHIQLRGMLDPKKGFLSALDIYVVSSRTEGMPLSLIEAMQHGKPSVVSSAGGSSEAARPGLEGLTFKAGDVRSLTQALEKLISDQDLRESLGCSAQARATNYLTLTRCAQEYEQLYFDVLKARTSLSDVPSDAGQVARRDSKSPPREDAVRHPLGSEEIQSEHSLPK